MPSAEARRRWRDKGQCVDCRMPSKTARCPACKKKSNQGASSKRAMEKYRLGKAEQNRRDRAPTKNRRV